MNAIAKGFASDLVAAGFPAGNNRYACKIGGEIVICKGVNQEGKPWKIRIDSLKTGMCIRRKHVEVVIRLTGKALWPLPVITGISILKTGKNMPIQLIPEPVCLYYIIF